MGYGDRLFSSGPASPVIRGISSGFAAPGVPAQGVYPAPATFRSYSPNTARRTSRSPDMRPKNNQSPRSGFDEEAFYDRYYSVMKGREDRKSEYQIQKARQQVSQDLDELEECSFQPKLVTKSAGKRRLQEQLETLKSSANSMVRAQKTYLDILKQVHVDEKLEHSVPSKSRAVERSVSATLVQAPTIAGIRTESPGHRRLMRPPAKDDDTPDGPDLAEQLHNQHVDRASALRLRRQLIRLQLVLKLVQLEDQWHKTMASARKVLPPKCWHAPGVNKAVTAFDTRLVSKLKCQPWYAEISALSAPPQTLDITPSIGFRSPVVRTRSAWSGQGTSWSPVPPTPTGLPESVRLSPGLAPSWSSPEVSMPMLGSAGGWEFPAALHRSSSTLGGPFQLDMGGLGPPVLGMSGSGQVGQLSPQQTQFGSQSLLPPPPLLGQVPSFPGNPPSILESPLLYSAR